jgi:hypothetical protein
VEEKAIEVNVLSFVGIRLCEGVYPFVGVIFPCGLIAPAQEWHVIERTRVAEPMVRRNILYFQPSMVFHHNISVIVYVLTFELIIYILLLNML